MRKVIKTLFLTVLLIIIVGVLLAFDTAPSADEFTQEHVNNAETVQPLLNELRQSLRSRYEAQQINVSKMQASSLAGFIHRAKDKANAKVAFFDKKMVMVLTYEINTVIVPIYINVEITLLEGPGFTVESVKIGSLNMPGEMALDLAEYLTNTYTSSVVATEAIESVRSLAISNNGVQIELQPLDSLLREFKNIETGGSRKDTRILKIRIAHYLRLLDSMNLPPSTNNEGASALSYYLHGAMREAAILSQQGSATLENEAAIIAIAIFAGSRRFTTLIGDLSFAIERIPYASPKPVLKNREDLSLHFVFSAAIKLLSEKGISIALGEFKELMDRGNGGSGYSFVDLAADLSGAHFAELALDPKRAQFVQETMALEANEDLFMVSIEGLEEGLNKAEFNEKYGEVDSAAYKNVVAIINKRINALPISQQAETDIKE